MKFILRFDVKKSDTAIGAAVFEKSFILASFVFKFFSAKFWVKVQSRFRFVLREMHMYMSRLLRKKHQPVQRSIQKLIIALKGQHPENYKTE